MTTIPIRSLVALVTALIVPAAAAAQGRPAPPPLPPRVEEKDSRPPIPPGVPTTADNVHLPTEGEVKLGRQSAVEVEREYHVITSGPYVERLRRVSRVVVEAIQRQDVIGEYRRVYHLPRSNDRARRVPFEFNFKVVDSTRVINAFSLAGGPVYVTKGLMDYATSDHELAAVLAHECTHVAFHHVEQLVRKERKLSSAQIWGLLATIMAGVAGGGQAAAAAGNVLMGAQLVSIATLTGYGRDLESEADRIGVLALRGTRYNPIGMLTFMEKLARDDRLHGNPDAGIFQSHPYSNERTAALRKQLETLGYHLDPGIERQVSGRFRVAAEATQRDGRAAAEVRLNGNILFVAVANEDGLGPIERGERIARRLQDLFAQNLSFNDVRKSPDKSALLLRGSPVIRVFPEDAAVLGSAAAVTERAYSAISLALLQEKLDSPG